MLNTNAVNDDRFLAAWLYLWHKTYVPTFIERFLLPVLVIIAAAVIITNPMQMDRQQRISLGIAILAFAYFVGHSLYAHQTQPKPQDLKMRASKLSNEILEFAAAR